MELSKWLLDNGIGVVAFAHRLRLHRSQVSAILNRGVIPNRTTCAAIEKATNHEVTRVDLARTSYQRAWPGKDQDDD